MKNLNKIPYFVTGGFVIFVCLCAALELAWAGFRFFVLAGIMLLSMFWGGWLIFQYYTSFQKELEKEFEIFRCEKINKTSITSEIFDQNLAVYKKEFKKKSLRFKFAKWAMIVLCFAVAAMFLLAIIYMAK